MQLTIFFRVKKGIVQASKIHWQIAVSHGLFYLIFSIRNFKLLKLRRAEDRRRRKYITIRRENFLTIKIRGQSTRQGLYSQGFQKFYILFYKKR